MNRRAIALFASFVLAVAAKSSAEAAGIPPEVASFAKAVLGSCESDGGHPGSGIALASDLNGDRSPEWVVVDGGPMCSGARGPSPRPFTVTIFTADKNGEARPAFQRAAFGYRLNRGVLWLAQRGTNCGAADPKVSCDRALQWIPTAKIFTFADPATNKSPSAIAP